MKRQVEPNSAPPPKEPPAWDRIKEFLNGLNPWENAEKRARTVVDHARSQAEAAGKVLIEDADAKFRASGAALVDRAAERAEATGKELVNHAQRSMESFWPKAVAQIEEMLNRQREQAERQALRVVYRAALLLLAIGVGLLVLGFVLFRYAA